MSSGEVRLGRSVRFARDHDSLHFITRCLSAGTRPDGRSPSLARPPLADMGSVSGADGSCSVSIGATRIVCAIHARLGPPSALSPNAGSVSVRLQLPSWTRARDSLPDESGCVDVNDQEVSEGLDAEDLFGDGVRPEDLIPPEDRAMEATDIDEQDGWDRLLIEEDLRAVCDSGALPLPSLCVSAHRVVWHLNADLIALDRDGAERTAAVLAFMGALRHLRLPEVSFTAADPVRGIEASVSVDPKRLRGVSLAGDCIAFEAMVMPEAEEGPMVLSDPTRLEVETLSAQPHGTACLLLFTPKDSKKEKMIRFEYSGDPCVPLTASLRSGLVAAASSRSKDLLKRLKSA